VFVAPAERTDVELLASIARGDHDALETLYRRHARWILQRLSMRCGDPEVVDTALQDTFVSVWRSACGFHAAANSDSAGGWLWSIALRRLIDQLRRNRRRLSTIAVTATPPEPEPLPPPGTPAFDLLSRLPSDLHSVATAIYLDGLTTAETAVLLGIPQGTVKSRLARAKPLIAKELR
jgi:DNA-directed RNA polymerase specialized sigma24 family protein